MKVIILGVLFGLVINNAIASSCEEEEQATQEAVESRSGITRTFAAQLDCKIRELREKRASDNSSSNNSHYNNQDDLSSNYRDNSEYYNEGDSFSNDMDYSEDDSSSDNIYYDSEDD